MSKPGVVVTGLPLLGLSRTGRVVTFDDDAGLGVIEDATTSFAFHCTAIADGSRYIVTDTDVTFTLRAGVGGELEATNIVASS